MKEIIEFRVVEDPLLIVGCPKLKENDLDLDVATFT
jgi:hypothetical protein